MTIILRRGGKMDKNRFLIVVCLILGILLFSKTGLSQKADKIENLFEKLSWRCVGPAVMGGRTVDVEAVEKAPWIIYAAIGPSGVWKSENSGITWEPVFYKEKTVSVGDLAIAQSHPNIIWVGSGEATCRNSVTIGDGVYKSVDGGKTWTNMGLEDSRHIGRIIINPGDPNIVYVAAMGHLWGANEERGIYKTLDGGKTWEKILYVDQNTGFADLAIDPEDSLTLYAAAYEHRRLPYHFTSGGPGSGLYKTIDGGKTWQHLTKDLPEGILGRIGIAVSRSNPNVVYALIEHKEGGIWRSEDKGQTWKRTCDTKTYRRVNFRPFYYSQIRVDPSDDKVIYVFSGGLFVSRDMGNKFKPISGGTHPDHHALWINPSNPLHLIDGNDGGIDISYDGGKNWYGIQKMTVAEVYHIGYDMRRPYHVYCGLQDNGSWGGPSATYDSKGIQNSDWYMIGGGDGFFTQVDPTDHNIVYSNWQMNGLYRHDLRIQRSKTIRPSASLQEVPFRFNWNSPIHISPHDPKTIYTGGNYLFRSTDRGHSWEIISPDLTTNDPQKQKDSGGPITPDNTGAEMHCSILTVAESPVERDVIWVGTDDGNVQITRDGGKTWQNVVKNIPGLPPNTWCACIETSHFQKGKAYAAFDGHRHDDYRTYVYKTTDYGNTWTSLRANLPFGWAHVIREDPFNRNLLFVGTEFGVHASLDDGISWFSLKNDLPTVAVRDIAIHPRDRDLIIGTHGRGIWILDDITPIEEMNGEVLASGERLFSIRPAAAVFRSSTGEPYSKPIYAAKNPDYGMGINLYLKEKPKDRPKLHIIDKEGITLFEAKLPKKEGIQRFIWNLQYIPKTKEGKTIKPGLAGFVAAPLASPGEYRINISVDEETYEKIGTVLPDHRFQMSPEDKAAQVDALTQLIITSKKMGLSITSAKNIRRELDKFYKSQKDKQDKNEQLIQAVEDFDNRFFKIEDVVVPKPFGTRESREMALKGGSLSQQIISLASSISGYPSAPSQTELKQVQEFSEEVDRLVGRLNKLIQTDLVELNATLEAGGTKPLKIPKEVKLDI